MSTSRHAVPAELQKLYAIERDAEELCLRPLATAGPGQGARHAMIAGVVLGLAALAAGFAIGYANQTRQTDGPRPPAWTNWLVPGGVFFALGGLALTGVVKLALQRNRILTITSNGAVYHGRRELVRAGAATAVCLDRRFRRTRTTTSEGIASGPSFELRWAYVYVLASGGVVELPAPYFSNIEGHDAAEQLADAVAAALRVPRTNDLPPGADPNPDAIVLRRRFAGGVMIAFGAMAFIVGFSLLAVHAGAAIVPSMKKPAAVQWWAGLPFAIGGSGFAAIGCRLLNWSVRRWAILLMVQAAISFSAVLAIQWYG